LGGDPNLLGRSVRLNDQSYTVVGVMPESFQFPQASFPFGEPAEIWTPLVFDPERVASRSGPYFLNVIARLKPGVTLAQARAEMSKLAKNFEQQHRSYRGPGGADGGWRITLTSLQEEVTGQSRLALLILFGAVGLVLLIACANVANLLLMRAAVRQREIAIRAALGASRFRIIRQLLMESLSLAAPGGLVGLLLAWWCVDALTALSPDNLPLVKEARVDGRVFVFTLLLSMLTGLVFGLAPALQASNPDVQRVLKDGSARRGRHWLRHLLVVGEVAIAVLLLIGAGLLINSFVRLQRIKPGMDLDKLLMVELSLPRSRYPEAGKAGAFYQELVRRVEALPGVEQASLGNIIPLSGTETNDPFSIEGRPFDLSSAPVAGWQLVTPNYFRTLGIPIMQGRDFTEHDHAESPNVAIINETMARRYWPNEDPLGQRIMLGAAQPDRPWSIIIGVARDIPHRTIDSQPEPDWYLPYLREPQRAMRLFVRSSGDPSGLASAVREQVWAIDKDQPITSLVTMSELVASTVAPRRFNTLLLGLFAAVALVLAALGIYSVISYSVTQRTHEIGVRLALGAQAKDVLRLIVRQGMALALAGIAIGWVAAFAFTRLMAGLLYEVSATDPATYIAITLLLTAVAWLACFLPARRAARVDPMVALRYE
jgi:putative ABC transport system permease protein